MVDVLEGLDPDELDRRSERRHDVEDMDVGRTASAWFDVDETVAAYCKAKGTDGIEETVASSSGSQASGNSRNCEPAVTASRLMCRYPQWPRYVGGPPKDAASFSCVGESE
jgi:hypothetical protein